MDMREPDVRDIEGAIYEVRPLPTTKGLRLMTRLARILGDGAGALMEGSSGVAKALPALLESIPDDLLAEVCVMLGERTTVVLSPSQKPPLTGEFFEVHFAGRYHVLVQWLRFALEVNYGPLAGWLRTAAASTPTPGAKTAA